MGLSQYHAKRDFSRTHEPKGRSRSSTCATTGGRFVVQKHAARQLHYDFRLEINHVLKSWALPRGVPTVHGDKRLAVEVEDHPVDYGSFEGVIPAGNYGAGTVMIWDTGEFKCLERSPGAALRAGKLEVRLAGDKLKGHWTLVRMNRAQFGSDKAWLLIKTEESVKDISARMDDRSVLSGKTMRQIAADRENHRHSDRKQDTPWAGSKRRRKRP
jgi:bifunctional non-homologous end joining protein LigD